nr:MAG TPA_asm: hypothetical protein [Caudoviricetes sp.]
MALDNRCLSGLSLSAYKLFHWQFAVPSYIQKLQ